MKELKKQIRKKYLSLRDNIPKKQIIKNSDIILSALFSLEEYKNSKTIFTYVNAKSEIITIPLIKKAWEDKKTLAVPVMSGKPHEMFFIKINTLDELKPNKYSIPEPELKSENIVLSDNKTLIIVPGIVFDYDKYRIGYGGGYYDKFISDNISLSNVALAMDFQIIDSVPKEIFDKQLDKIITQSKIY